MIAILLLIGVQPLSLRAQPAGPMSAYADQETPVVALDTWFYRWGNASPWADTSGWRSTTTLFNPAGEEENVVWFRARLPEDLPAQAAIGTRYIWLSYEAYLDDELFARFGVMGADPENKYNASQLQILSLPEYAGGRTLYLKVYSPYASIIGIPYEVYLSSYPSLINFALRNNLSTLIIGLILSVLGILLLFMWLHRRKQPPLLLFLSLFSFCYGINYVANHAASDLILGRPELLHFGVILFVLFPVGLLGLFEQTIGAGYKAIIRKLRYTHLVLWIVILLLDVFNVVLYFQSGFLFFSLLGVSLVAMLFTVIPAIREGQTGAKIFGLGIILASLTGLFDTIFQGLLIQYNLPPLSPWGVMTFMVMLGFLLDRHLSENATKLQEAHTQLETYSATLEQRVARRTNELSAKNETLTTTLNELRTAQDQLVQTEKMASLGQLTAGIAHEIKNPLNFVNNFAALSIELADELAASLENGEAVGDILDDLKMNAAHIAKHGRRADQIVQSMMQHASGSKGIREEIDLNTFVEDYVNLGYHGMRARHGDLNPVIERNYAPDLPPVAIIRQDIGRVLINLINNAFDALREKAGDAPKDFRPTLKVETFRNNDHIGFKITDNGPGIPPDVLDRIFEPFFTTKPAGSGTGLGLSLSYEIVTQGHGGSLEATSEAGGGATFVLALPFQSPQNQ